ncbi:MAG: TetR family transcriptional regulator [Bryobacteraceae bacterium]|nr:TetR family transcriptional regulator [Bryobacteraceae bacterium]
MIETPFERGAPFAGTPSSGESRARAAATRERILDAAERLFAEHGFAGTSLRDITAEAGVNLAAVNYHFGSKDELFLAVVIRRLEPVNRRRLEMLEQAERQADPPRLEDVARAFVQPVVEARDEEGEVSVLPKLMARVVGEPGGWAEKILPLTFGAVAARFLGSLERALPGVPRADLLWGLVFSAGVLSHYLLLGDLIGRITGRWMEEAQAAETVERMTAYITAGLRGLAGQRVRGGAKNAGGKRGKQKGKKR